MADHACPTTAPAKGTSTPVPEIDIPKPVAKHPLQNVPAPKVFIQSINPKETPLLTTYRLLTIHQSRRSPLEQQSSTKMTPSLSPKSSNHSSFEA